MPDLIGCMSRDLLTLVAQVITGEARNPQMHVGNAFKAVGFSPAENLNVSAFANPNGGYRMGTIMLVRFLRDSVSALAHHDRNIIQIG